MVNSVVGSHRAPTNDTGGRDSRKGDDGGCGHGSRSRGIIEVFAPETQQKDESDHVRYPCDTLIPEQLSESFIREQTTGTCDTPMYDLVATERNLASVSGLSDTVIHDKDSPGAI